MSDTPDPTDLPEPEPNPAPEPAPEPDPEPASEPAADPAPEPAAAAPAADWRDRRIAQLTARLRESQAAGKSTEPGEPAVPGTTTQAELDALVNARAAEQAAVSEFNRRCNEVVTEGQTAFADFDARVGALKGLVDFGDPGDAARYNNFIVAALETGEAPKLLHSLGSNPNEAMRIMGLSPVRMAVELTRLAGKPEDQISGAPRPIRPVSTASPGSRNPIEPDDPEREHNLSTAEWMRRREAQIAQRAPARGGR